MSSGLSRFDGISFENLSNTGDILFGNITKILEDRTGRLWVCSSGGGIICIQKGKITAFGVADGLPDDKVLCAAEDERGTLWFGTEKGLCKFTGHGFTSVFNYSHQRFEYISTILPAKNGVLWLGTHTGLERLHRGKSTFFDTAGVQAGGKVLSLAFDQHGTLWIGTSGGLCSLRNNALRSYKVSNDSPGNFIQDILSAQDGTVWLATTNGIYRFKPGKFPRFQRIDELPNKNVLDLFQDQEGSIWLCTLSGISRFLSSDFTNFTTDDGLSNNLIWSIAERKKGELWFGTDNGLSRFQDGRFRNYHTGDGLPSNNIYALLADRKERLWMGTSQGVSVLSGGSFTNYNINHGLLNDLVLSFTEDRSGTIWIATAGGISLFDNTLHPPPFKEKVKQVHFILERNNGDMIFSTYRRIFKIVEDRTIILYAPPNTSINAIFFIFEDSKNRLWFGTRRGLNCLSNGILTQFTTKDNLAHDVCCSAVEDGDGNLWFGTSGGVSRYNGKTFNSFSSRDGLIYDEMSEGACLQDHNGDLWFGSAGGLTRFNPGVRHYYSVSNLPVHITRLKQLDRDIPLDKAISLEYHQNHLRFDFIGLYFHAPEKVIYQYRLKELDPRWQETNLRSVEYTYLPPGDYTFQVTAGLPGGGGGKQPAEITFSISPPFYRTWWFVNTALLAFAILSYLVINFSKKYLVLLAFWRKKKYIGHYRLLETIGSGGMGTVYLAENLMDKSRFVALKVLRDEVSGDEDQRKRFINEALTIDQIRHPNIVKIYERGEHNRQLYIAMEFLDGINLGEKIKEDRPIPLEQCLSIARQLAGALQKIHEKGVIHRDLKPENVMLLEEPGAPITVKLLDFGLAKLQFQTRITETGVLVGTIPYMSPEQFRRGTITFAHDIYSLGVLFYEMFTGQKPFHGETEHETLVKILEELPRPPRRHRPDLPVHLDRLITAMMAKDQNRRPDIGEVIQYLSGK